MRKILLILVLLESALLAGGVGFHLFSGLDRFQRRLPAVPVFRPAIATAAIGDMVRYARADKATGASLGTLEYEIRWAEVTKGTMLGPQYVIKITETDASGDKRDRMIRFRPRAASQGFLPPRLDDDDDYPTGARPLVKAIATATFDYRGESVDGFLIEAVVPRESLTEVRERLWIHDQIPVFGVARWETADEVRTVLRSERGGRR